MRTSFSEALVRIIPPMNTADIIIELLQVVGLRQCLVPATTQIKCSTKVAAERSRHGCIEESGDHREEKVGALWNHRMGCTRQNGKLGFR